MAKVEIKGLDTVLMKLMALGKEGDSIASKGLSALSKKAKELVQADTPVFAGKVSEGHPEPGSMQKAARNSSVRGKPGQRTYKVYYVHGKDRQQVGRGKRKKNMDVYYSRFVMQGSKHNPNPKDIMGNVVRDHEDELIEIFRQRAEEEIKKIW